MGTVAWPLGDSLFLAGSVEKMDGMHSVSLCLVKFDSVDNSRRER